MKTILSSNHLKSLCDPQDASRPELSEAIATCGIPALENAAGWNWDVLLDTYQILRIWYEKKNVKHLNNFYIDDMLKWSYFEHIGLKKIYY